MSLVVVAGLVWTERNSPYEAQVPSSASPTARSGAAAATVQDLVAALVAGDAAQAAGLAPTADHHAGEQLAAAAANARALHLTDLSARYVDEVGAVAPDGSWTAAVELTWAVAGFDREPARAEVLIDFTLDGARVSIAGLGGDGRISPLWLDQRVSVRRTASALVMAAGHDSPRTAHDYLQRVRRAIPVVQRVLPRWHPHVVVEVPASAAGLDASLDVPSGTYASIAAVTAQADGSGRSDAPVRVFVNPEVTGRLRGAGAQVVVSHELVHVATDAATASIDPWLLEGFADYVALRDVKLPLRVTASQARRSVRRDGQPNHLPGTAEFDPAAGDLEAAYELAWLACVEVADEAGEQGLVRAYRLASAGADTRVALAHIGVSVADLLRGWHRRLRALAS